MSINSDVLVPKLAAEFERRLCRFQVATPEQKPEALCRLSDAVRTLAYLQVPGTRPELESAVEGVAVRITIPFGMPLREAERQIIETTLQYTGGNVAATARILQIGRSRLYERIRGYKDAAKDTAPSAREEPSGMNPRH